MYGRVRHIDVAGKRLTLEDGRQVAYHKLLIATGARAVPPPVPGADLQGVVYLDDMAGTEEMLRRARRARRGVVVGGGITALELTEGFLKQKVETHYFVRRDRLWSSVFNDAESALLEAQMRHHGAHIHYNTEIDEILGDRRGRVRAVRLQDGSEFPCDCVGVAIGVKPVLDLVRDTPLKVDRGILVDETLRSSVADVYAAGDCAQVFDRWTKSHTLDILWPSAVAEGRVAAANMAGLRQPYVKGTPFNACLLFGLHITTIGQVNPRAHEADDPLVVQTLSRGSSEVWYTFPRSYGSAWSQNGPNTIRLVFDGSQLVGALIVGEQTQADLLRDLIENEVATTAWQPYLQAGQFPPTAAIVDLWRQWRRESDPCAV